MPIYSSSRYKNTCVASNRGKDDISCMMWCILIRLIFLFSTVSSKRKHRYCVSSSRIKRCSVTSAIICWEPFFCSFTTHITTKKTNNFYNITHPLHHISMHVYILSYVCEAIRIYSLNIVSIPSHIPTVQQYS